MASPNIFLFYLKIRQTNNLMEDLTNRPVSRKAEHRLIRKVLAIVGLFFCCHIITISISFSLFFAPDQPLFYNALGGVFVTLNSSINITIYCGFDRRFREQLKNMVYCCSNRNLSQAKVNILHFDNQTHCIYNSNQLIVQESKWPQLIYFYFIKDQTN